MRTGETNVKFLCDTNILISLEPASLELELTAPVAAEFLSLCSQGGHAVVRHRAQAVDHGQDRNAARRGAREVLFNKYPLLPRVRAMGPEMEQALGVAVPGSNDWVDNQLLGALEADAVDFVVTEDAGIHRKAKRAGLGGRVLLVADARDMLRALLDRPPAAPPVARWLSATELDERDSIFDSVRADYPDFDKWLGHCRKESRDVAVVPTAEGGYAAVCILARKADKFGMQGKFLKIGQFKVAEAYRGRRYGELLLKAVFDYRYANAFDYAYVTVFDRHEALIRLFEDFGFGRWVVRSDRGEVILVKGFHPAAGDRIALSPLEFHVRFGPPALNPDPNETYVVPIQPPFHRLLFPEAEVQVAPGQLELGIEAAVDRPFGNSLRKAYLCRAQHRNLPSGSTLLFYRSRDLSAVTCVGVVERTTRGNDAPEIARLVGKRTVYTYEQIRELATRPVLSVLFRQDRVLPRPIGLAELLRRQLLSGHPQTITRVKKEGFAWMMDQIGV